MKRSITTWTNGQAHVYKHNSVHIHVLYLYWLQIHSASELYCLSSNVVTCIYNIYMLVVS